MAKFMVVDDSSIVRKTLSKQLEEMGHEVVFAAENGQEAVNYYEWHGATIDMITMDISMPVLNGLAALKEIIEINHKVKVLMVTSHGEEEMVMDAVEAGAIGYILKPITKEKLERQLEKL